MFLSKHIPLRSAVWARQKPFPVRPPHSTGLSYTFLEKKMKKVLSIPALIMTVAMIALPAKAEQRYEVATTAWLVKAMGDEAKGLTGGDLAKRLNGLNFGYSKAAMAAMPNFGIIVVPRTLKDIQWANQQIPKDFSLRIPEDVGDGLAAAVFVKAESRWSSKGWETAQDRFAVRAPVLEMPGGKIGGIIDAGDYAVYVLESDATGPEAFLELENLRSKGVQTDYIGLDMPNVEEKISVDLTSTLSGTVFGDGSTLALALQEASLSMDKDGFTAKALTIGLSEKGLFFPPKGELYKIKKNFVVGVFDKKLGGFIFILPVEKK